MNRSEAFMILGIEPNSSLDDIKRRYKLLCKQYHPDQNKESYAGKYYLQIQEAYQYLKEHPYPDNWVNQGSQIYGSYRGMSNNTSFGVQYGYTDGRYWNNVPQYQRNVRPVKIFSTDKNAEKLHQRQVKYAEDKKRVENMMKEKNMEPDIATGTSKQQEEKTIKAIQALWLAEQIHRTIEQDKIRKEKEQKNKLYKAFSQHYIHEEEKRGDMS